MKPLGTGVWNDPRIFKTPALQSGWFAAPDSAGFNAFAARYRTRFNADPTRIATLSYDAVSLAAALVRTQGSQRFAEPVLTNPSGFAGADGVFRFKPDGTNDRALAVLEIRNGADRDRQPRPEGAVAVGDLIHSRRRGPTQPPRAAPRRRQPRGNARSLPRSSRRR